MSNYKCPRCKGELSMSIENGSIELGEDPMEKHERYICKKCKSFWGHGDVNVATGEGGKDE